MSRYSFCESVAAITWHIREVGPEGIKLGGGAGAPLCVVHEGRWTWINGWDLDVPLTEHHLGQACPQCVALYRAARRKERS